MSYTAELEEMINKHLLPAFNAYYDTVSLPKPALDVGLLLLVQANKDKKVPALLKKRMGCWS
jgi:hypothetical protein